MTTTEVTRHQVEIGVPDGYDGRVAEDIEYHIGRAEAHPGRLQDILDDSLRLMGWRCYLDPVVRKVETWEATVMAMQAATAIFDIANATEGEVTVLVGEKTLTLSAGATKSIANAGNWVTAYHLSVICREQERLTMLAQTPIELLRATGAQFDEYIYAWVDTLQTYWQEGPDIGAKLQAAVEGTDPDTVAPPDLMLKVLYPPILLFYRFLQTQRQEFNTALTQALELHKQYWDTPDEARNRKPAAAVPLGALAMTCLAHDAEFPIEIESDYLPKHLVQRTWLGEFPTRN